MHTWIKLHLSLRDSEVYADPNARTVFIHLLLIANKNGIGRVSRYSTSLELGMKPSTFSKALKRCQQQYLLCNTKSNNRFTTFYILNWDSYQQLGDNQRNSQGTATDNQRNSQGTATDNQRNSQGTLIEENKNKKRIKKINKKSFSSISDLDKTVFTQLAQEYDCSVTTVEKKYLDLVDYCQSKGKVYKNYLATLRAWVRKEVNYDPSRAAEKAKKLKEIEEFKKGFGG